MTIRTLKTLLFLYILFLSLNVSAKVEVVTIKDLQNNIKVLEQKQGEISKKFSSDFWDIWEIQKFLKTNLSENEVSEINSIISNYNFSKDKINLQLNDDIKTKKLLLDLKKETYKNLTPYIENSKLNDYLNFIKLNVDIFKQWRELNQEIDKNKELLDKKVTSIKEKIKVHESELNSEITKLINDKIDEKLEIIKNNKKFIVLDLETRKILITKTIEKIILKKKIFELEVLILQKR